MRPLVHRRAPVPYPYPSRPLRVITLAPASALVEPGPRRRGRRGRVLGQLIPGGPNVPRHPGTSTVPGRRDAVSRSWSPSKSAGTPTAARVRKRDERGPTILARRAVGAMTFAYHPAPDRTKPPWPGGGTRASEDAQKGHSHHRVWLRDTGTEGTTTKGRGCHQPRPQLAKGRSLT